MGGDVRASMASIPLRAPPCRCSAPPHRGEEAVEGARMPRGAQGDTGGGAQGAWPASSSANLGLAESARL